MSEQLQIKYPVALKDWHMYVPQPPNPRMSGVREHSRQEVMRRQSQLYTLTLLWKAEIEAQYACSFDIREFQYQHTTFQEYSAESFPSITFRVRSPFLSFSVYLDERMAAILLGNAFGTPTPTRLMHSDLENIFFQQMFSETLSPVLKQGNIDISSMEKSIGYDLKDADHFHTFYTRISPMKESFRISFAFSSAEQDRFFENLLLSKDNFPTIIVPPDAQRNITTGVSVRLGDVMLTLADLRTLQPGDVLLLKKKVGDSVEVTIGEELKFSAGVGIHQKKLSVQLLKHLNKNEQVEESSFPETQTSDAVEAVEESMLQTDQELIDIDTDDDNDDDDDFDWEKL